MQCIAKATGTLCKNLNGTDTHEMKWNSTNGNGDCNLEFHKYIGELLECCCIIEVRTICIYFN